MSIRKFVGQLLGAATLVAVGLSGSEARAGEVLKIGTLAPAPSPWGQVFKVWAAAVKKKTDGRLELQFFFNGQQGDESAMVAKMKSGQLDGAAVTAVGLSKIHKPILALQMPGLFQDWTKLDAARDAMKTDFEKGASDAGFSIVGWGDVGAVHTMSKGFEVRVPTDLQDKKPYMWKDDIIMPVVFQKITKVTGVPLTIPEVLPKLTSGAVNVVSAPSLAAEQLQWASRLDHITSDTSNMAIGALVFSSKKLDGLPADLKEVLAETGKVASSALTTKIRAEDAAAFGRMKAKGKMTEVVLKSDEQTKWSDLFREVRKQLAQGTFEKDLVEKLEKLK